MKIAVVCANGKAGKLIVKEAVDRGLDVTAVVREANQSAAGKVLQNDLFDLTRADLEGFDVVIDAFGAWTEDTLPQHSTSLKHLCDALSGTDTRLLIVGGAGSLYVNPEHTACVADGPDFPDAFKPLAAAMAKALTELRARSDVKWTYLSPAADFQAEGGAHRQVPAGRRGADPQQPGRERHQLRRLRHRHGGRGPEGQPHPAAHQRCESLSNGKDRPLSGGLFPFPSPWREGRERLKGASAMTQSQRREYLIRCLLQERPEYAGLPIPMGEEEQRRLLRSLMNLRPPAPISGEFLRVQDAYLRERLKERGVTQLGDLRPAQPGLYLWQGDITTLEVDAIVNAANSGMTGCYVPCHSCIDNAIHTFAGVQLRLACAELMAKQGCPEPTGQAKITKAYNLPCRYVLHTVGPIVSGTVDKGARAAAGVLLPLLPGLGGGKSTAKAWPSAASPQVSSTFPNERAAEIAVETVKAWQAQHPGELEVVFNVFKDSDREIYEKLLG